MYINDTSYDNKMTTIILMMMRVQILINDENDVDNDNDDNDSIDVIYDCSDYDALINKKATVYYQWS